MAADDVTKMQIYQAAVFTGTAGATAATGLGYVLEEDPVTIANAVPAHQEVRVQGKKLPVRHVQPNRQILISVPLAQLEVANVALSQGVTAQSNLALLGDSTDTILCPQISVAVVGQDLAGNAIRLDVKYASVIPNNSIAATQAGFSKIDQVIFAAEAGINDATQPFWTFGDTSITASGGILTRTLPLHLVKGEGDVADAITDIIGTTNQPLVEGETLRLMPFTTSYLLTLTHGADTLTLLGAANYDLGTFLADWIDLTYVMATTEWVERGRYSPRTG